MKLLLGRIKHEILRMHRKDEMLGRRGRLYVWCPRCDYESKGVVIKKEKKDEEDARDSETDS